jgi:predicted NUDIX family NTP pyrophosphohydrolase
MPKQSAGLIVYRRKDGRIEVLLAHPGGPFWMKKDDGAWSIPKGEVDKEEELESAAKREFLEETNLIINGPLASLGSVRLKSGKVLHAFAMEADPDLAGFASNTFDIEWPPHSGQTLTFPEVDRVQFFGLEEARRKLNAGQVELVDRLVKLLE